MDMEQAEKMLTGKKTAMHWTTGLFFGTDSAIPSR